MKNVEDSMEITMMIAKMSSYMPASKSDTHITPDRVFELIQAKWGYKYDSFFDPCPVNGTDGLEVDWEKLNFVNPPYTLLREFVAKAHYECYWHKKVTVLLLPVKTDQMWFHDYIIEKGYEILWIQKRLKFKNNKWAATQPHFLVRMK